MPCGRTAFDDERLGPGRRIRLSPDGAAETSGTQPSLRDSNITGPGYPTLKTLGYCRMSLRDKNSRQRRGTIPGGI